MKNNSKKMIQEICEEEKINYKFLSKDWVIMLEKNDKIRFISGYKFDLNMHAMGLIADDKYALYEVLRDKCIPIIEHKIVYNKTNKADYAAECNTYEYVKDYFMKNNNSIVIKPNEGTFGRNVFKVTDVNKIDEILDKLFLSNYSISICPFYKIEHEYRSIMLNGECKLLYAKCLPRVVGDGKRTIKELLIEFNHDYFINRLEESKFNRVLEKDEEYEYNWKFNLSQGSISKKVEDEALADKIINLAKTVCSKINLKFGSVDIIHTTDDKLFVLEVNSGVMVENYVRLNPEEYGKIKNIYKAAIEELFKE